MEGQATLDSLYKGYGDIPPFGNGVDQQKIHNRGNAYVRQDFPKTDFLTSCKVVEEISSMVFDHSADEAEEKRKKEEEKKLEELDGERDIRTDDEISEEKRLQEEQEKEDEEEEEEEEEMEEEKEAFQEEAEANTRGKVLNHIPRGPDELDKLAAFDSKTRLRTGKAHNNLRDQIKKSQTIILDKKSSDMRVAFFAIGILSFFCSVLYCLHRQRANKTANGKRS